MTGVGSPGVGFGGSVIGPSNFPGLSSVPHPGGSEGPFCLLPSPHGTLTCTTVPFGSVMSYGGMHPAVAGGSVGEGAMPAAGASPASMSWLTSDGPHAAMNANAIATKKLLMAPDRN